MAGLENRLLSQLQTVTNLKSGDLIYVAQDGKPRKASFGDLLSLIKSELPEIVSTLDGPLLLTLNGPQLKIPLGQTLQLTLANRDDYCTYSVSATTGTASINGRIISYDGSRVGNDTLTININDYRRALSIAVLDPNGLMDTPAAPPEFGKPLEGGFYTGVIWDKVCAATGELTLSAGQHQLTVSAGDLPFYAGQQIRLAPGPTNPDQVFAEGIVVARNGTTLIMEIGAVDGSCTHSAWDIAARWKVIVAPKSGGENANIMFKTTNTNSPGACWTLTNGPAATAAMIERAIDYPMAAWVNGINRGNGIDGYYDWYIPARDELELIWRNLKPVADNNYTAVDRYNANPYTMDVNKDDLDVTHGTNRHSDPVGAAYRSDSPAKTPATAFMSDGAEALAFGAARYWSSSANSSTTAWVQFYDSSSPGKQTIANIAFSYRARAVRRSIF